MTEAAWKDKPDCPGRWWCDDRAITFSLQEIKRMVVMDGYRYYGPMDIPPDPDKNPDKNPDIVSEYPSDPQTITWSTLEVAATWPEGSVVLMSNPKTEEWGICAWWGPVGRPEWQPCDHFSLFARLERPDGRLAE